MAVVFDSFGNHYRGSVGDNSHGYRRQRPAVDFGTSERRRFESDRCFAGRVFAQSSPASALGVVTTTLKYADLEALLKKSNAPEIVDAAGYVSGSATIQYQQNSFAASYQGVSASFINIENNTLKEGRFFIERRRY